jgi:hypothetical protein
MHSEALSIFRPVYPVSTIIERMPITERSGKLIECLFCSRKLAGNQDNVSPLRLLIKHHYFSTAANVANTAFDV